MRTVGKGVIVIAVIYWLLALWPTSGPKHSVVPEKGGGSLVTRTQGPGLAPQRKRVEWTR